MRTKLYYKNRISLLRARDTARNEPTNLRIINALKREYRRKFNEEID